MKQKLFIVLILCLLAGNLYLYSQFSYKLIPEKSEISVKGTSSLHDWEMIVNTAAGSFLMKYDNNKISSISSIYFSCPVSGVTSHNSIMNDKAHDALKSDKHPEIVFRMLSVDIQDQSLNNFKGLVTGQLSIAGKTRNVIIPFQGSLFAKENIKISGIQILNMPDFGIEPPKAMLGALKTGNKVTVSFTLEFFNDSEANR